MEVVTIGHASLDRVNIKGKVKTQLGGAAIYSAMAAKIFGNVGIVTRVGRDFSPRFYKVLTASGVDIAGLKRTEGKSTAFSIKYDDNGIADYENYKLNAGIQISPKDIPKGYYNAKAFHLAPMAASKQIKFLNFLRKHAKGLISINTQMAYFTKYKKVLYDIISKADVFTLNDDEAMRLTGTKSLEHALNVLKRIKHNLIVVTMGVYGSIVIDKEINFFPSVYQPKVVDLTGCGDAFAGSFISSYLKTGDALKSANIANSVASIVATKWSFEGIKNLKFESIEGFQGFIVSRQRRLSKRQRAIEYFF